MRNQILIAIILLIIAAPLVAQKSDKAEKRANSWFNNDKDLFLPRMSGIQGPVLILWDSVVKKTIGKVHVQNTLHAMCDFNSLWDKNNKPDSGAIFKYAKRLEQIPAKAVEEWLILIGGSNALYASLSLTAENELFPKEKFNEIRFRTFIDKFK